MPETAAAAEGHRRAEARRSAHDRVELPHVIGFGLGVNLLAEPVLPRGDDVIEVVVACLVPVSHEVAKLRVIDVIQACVECIII